jgi:hypothetical protein
LRRRVQGNSNRWAWTVLTGNEPNMAGGWLVGESGEARDERGMRTSRRTVLAGLAASAALGQSSALAALRASNSIPAGGQTLGRERAATEMSQALQNAQVVYPVNFGMTGRYDQDATGRMQAMFDQIPDGSVVDFAHGIDLGGDYRITDTIIIRRSISLRGRHSRIVGVMGSRAVDLIRYQPTAELRGVVVEGMRLAFNAGGRDALVFDGGPIGVIENVVSRCSIAGGPGGYAIRLAGLGNHFNMVRDCTLTGTDARTGAVIIASADGNKLYDNVISGVGTGVRIQLVNGAYKVAVIGGAITARDIGVHIAAGQQIDIERVQFEQGRGNVSGDRNQATHAAHVVIDGSGIFPAGEEVRDIRIIACNFGGGTNLDAAITLVAYARDVLIDENLFAASAAGGADIKILAPSVLWTIVGVNNRVGGARAKITRGRENSADPKGLLVTADLGTGTYGVDKSAGALALESGWTAGSAFAFWKTPDDILRFRSTIRAGLVTAGTVVGTLPPGFRPRVDQRVTVPTDDDRSDARLAITAAGAITVRRTVAGATLYLDQLAVPIQGRSNYLSGPY